MKNIHSAMLSTPRGQMLALATDEALVGLWYSGQPTCPSVSSPSVSDVTSHPIMAMLDIQLGEYFERERREFTVPLEFAGTELRHAVWTRLLDIPYGQSTTYGQIAHDIGHPTAARAVGNAVGMNPISILVPCHRVLPASGRVGGYNGGVENKKALLSLEGIAIRE